MKRVILHLTDLHFGFEPGPSADPVLIAQRTNTLRSLLAELQNLEPQWRPDAVVISGDLGWAGRDTDYKELESWLGDLLGAVGLSVDRLVVCAGNHDIDRNEAEVLARPGEAEDADKLLNTRHLVRIGRPFRAFNDFCARAGIPPLSLGVDKSWLAGTRTAADIQFVVLNTAWFCRGDDDRGRLFLGYPHLEVMEAQHQVSRTVDQEPIRVGVLHHPEEWLHDAETNAYGDRPASYYQLARRTDVLLSGHTHGGVEDPKGVGKGAWRFVGGATYAGGRYRNNFALLRIDTDEGLVARRAYEFDARRGAWRVASSDDYRLGSSSRGSLATASSDSPVGAQIAPRLRADARAAAQRVIDSRSRIVARTRSLPHLRTRNVGVWDPRERRDTQDLQSWRARRDQPSLPFAEAARSNRPVFLIGELGSGKSTLVGQYVAQLNVPDGLVLGLMIPARHFLGRIPGGAGPLLDAVTAFVRTEVSPESKVFDLRGALDAGAEVTLVIDGLDEIGSNAQSLLSTLEAAAALYNRLQIIATGRPVELHGLSHGEWQVLQTLPLLREEQLDILRAEAEADGLMETAALGDARRRFTLLRQAPELLAVAETPLSLRLLRPLLGESITERTLGDLLHSVLTQRIGDWDRNEGKDLARPHFTGAIPNGPVRETLLGQVAHAIHRHTGGTISRTALRSIVQGFVGDNPRAAIALEEGVDFLRTSFLEGSDEQLAFSSQPLFQAALSLCLVPEAFDGTLVSRASEPGSMWREVSFVLTVLRRRGQLTVARQTVESYLTALLENGGVDSTPAVAAVVAESLDPALAEWAIDRFTKLPFQPLRYFEDRLGSASHFGRLIQLAGQCGFDWFYDQYLDPRYPYDEFFGEGLVGILRSWLVLVRFSPGSAALESLRAVPPPHLATQSAARYALLPAMVLVVPEAFPAQAVPYFIAQALSTPLLRDRAEALLRERARDAAQRAEVLGALESTVRTSGGLSGDEAHPALQLWLDLANGTPPTPSILRATASLAGREGLAEPPSLSILVPDERAVLRWYALSETSGEHGYALALFRRGERSFSLLSAGLLGAVRFSTEGGEARQALMHVFMENPHRWNWLAAQFADDRRVSRQPEVVWRLLVDALARSAVPDPSFLTYAASYLHHLTLSRYPELRRAIQLLLEREPIYRDELRDALSSISRARRFGAACLLLASDPKTELRALDVVVQGAVPSSAVQDWNWFAMRLDLGRPLLDRLRELAPTLATIPGTFAVSMLFHNGVELTMAEKEIAVEGLLGEAYWLDHAVWTQDAGPSVSSLLADPAAFPRLAEVVHVQAGERARRAAEALLHHHTDRMDPATEARAWAVANDAHDRLPDSWSERSLCERLTNPKFRESFKEEILAVQAILGREPAVTFYLRDDTDREAWRSLLWALFCSGRESGVGTKGPLRRVISRARNSAAVAAAVGAAANSLLSGPAGAQGAPGRDALALLGHSFGALNDEAVMDVLRDNAHTGASASVHAALLARLGQIPDGYRPPFHREEREWTRAAEPHLTPLTAPEVADQLRDREAITGDGLQVLERVIATGGMGSGDRDYLANQGLFGSFGAAVVAACFGAPPHMEWVVRSLGLQFAREQGLSPAERTWQRFTAWAVESAEHREECLTLLRGGFTSGGRTSLEWIFDLGQSLRFEEWELVLDRMVGRRQYWLNQYTNDRVVRALASVDGTGRLRLLPLLRRTGEALAASLPADMVGDDLFSICLIGHALLAFEDEPTPLAQRLYLLSLVGLFVSNRDSHGWSTRREPDVPGFELLHSVAPLTEIIPPERLRSCLQAGLHSDVPAIRASSRLLATAAGIPVPRHHHSGLRFERSSADPISEGPH